MAVCALPDASGVLTVQTVADLTQCSGYVVLQPSDYAQLQAANQALITNSANAVSIATGFVGLLAIAFTYRAILRVLDDSTSTGD